MSAKRIHVLLAMLVVAGTAYSAGGPIDAPVSSEPRVVAAKSLARLGLYSSEGNSKAFRRVHQGDDLYTRDVLVALPGFRAEVEPTSKAVKLMLWGNLPEQSSSPVLESAVVLHDTKAYDLDFTFLRGRIVLTNTRAKGEARVWLRTETAGVQLTLAEPGDQVALELYGRWPAGVPFGAKDSKPVKLWEAFVLKGNLRIKAGRNAYAMSAPPGRAYFHGNNQTGPAPEGPQPIKEIPDWANPDSKPSAEWKALSTAAAYYRSKVTADEADEVCKTLLALADKEKDRTRAALLRRIVVVAMGALDDVEHVAAMLNASPHPEVRQAAIVALRHWIGGGVGRDEKLHKVLTSLTGFSKVEAEAVMQMLHSPFASDQAETFDTLIAYLKHRKQAVRELAHWHLVRLSPVGGDIEFDAAAPAAVRAKAVAAWQKLIPTGTLPMLKKDGTKER